MQNASSLQLNCNASLSCMTRQLVRDLMTVGVETCSPDTPIVDLARALLDNAGEDIVVMQDGHALGTIGLEQMTQAYARGDYSELKAMDILHEGVPQIPPDIPLTAAAQIMLDLKVMTLYLMHHAGGVTYPAAMLSYRHILRHISAQKDEDLSDLGIYADRKSPVEAFIERRSAARRQKNLPEE
jgi:predicted transcriptional regulator